MKNTKNIIEKVRIQKPYIYDISPNDVSTDYAILQNYTLPWEISPGPVGFHPIQREGDVYNVYSMCIWDIHAYLYFLLACV